MKLLGQFFIMEGILVLKFIGEKNIRRIILIITDILCVIFSLYGALLLRFNGPIPEHNLERLFIMSLPILVIAIAIFWYFRLYHSLWQFASIIELKNIVLATIVDSLANIILFEVSGNSLPRSCYFIYFMLLTMFLGGERFLYRLLRLKHSKIGFNIDNKEVKDLQKVMIIGAGLAGEKIYREIINSKQVYKQVMCFIDDDRSKQGRSVHGVTVYGGRDKIVEAVEKFGIEEILVAIPSAEKKELADVLNICKETKCLIKKLPGMYELLNGNVHISDFKEVDVLDLLGRDPIEVNLEDIMGYVTDKVVMVTGGGGSIGSELCRQIAASKPKQLIIVDIYENNAYDIQLELKEKYHDLNLC